ncbi:hypothetical protein L484_027919 [Morus notabilis]|uniref:Uncharacterized protein n=1 Tax=Morus notabilis TaxID=981085 RepID=W9SHY8_9ROSA|nr:hypothetical protein L484_027919 [Morus notabilis]
MRVSGGTAGLTVGLAKLGPLIQTNGQVNEVRWLRLHGGWRPGILDTWFALEAVLWTCA